MWISLIPIIVVLAGCGGPGTEKSPAREQQPVHEPDDRSIIASSASFSHADLDATPLFAASRAMLGLYSPQLERRPQSPIDGGTRPDVRIAPNPAVSASGSFLVPSSERSMQGLRIRNSSGRFECSQFQAGTSAPRRQI
jgi:hypothetical protein